jgi:hypothetical protein
MTVSDYMNRMAREAYPPGTKWSLQTLASPKSGGETKQASGKEEAVKWIGEIIKSLETQPKALEYRLQTKEIRELGQRALLLLGEELG